MQGNQENMYEYVADIFGKDVFVPMPEGVQDEEHQCRTPEDMELKDLIYDIKKNQYNAKAIKMDPQQLQKIVNEDRLKSELDYKKKKAAERLQIEQTIRRQKFNRWDRDKAHFQFLDLFEKIRDVRDQRKKIHKTMLGGHFKDDDRKMMRLLKGDEYMNSDEEEYVYQITKNPHKDIDKELDDLIKNKNKKKGKKGKKKPDELDALAELFAAGKKKVEKKISP